MKASVRTALHENPQIRRSIADPGPDRPELSQRSLHDPRQEAPRHAPEGGGVECPQVDDIERHRLFARFGGRGPPGTTLSRGMR